MSSKGYTRFHNGEDDAAPKAPSATRVREEEGDNKGDSGNGAPTSSPEAATLPEHQDTDQGGASDPQDHGEEVVTFSNDEGEGLGGKSSEAERTEVGIESGTERGDDGRDGGGGDDDADVQTINRKWSVAACYQWLMSNAVLLYTSQILSAWGDRMWGFAVALFLVEIEEHSLRLTAVYGLCVSGSALLLGAAIGKWVDKTPRLRAVRKSLIIQNTSVLVNACILCAVLVFKADILPMWNGAIFIICEVLIILLGVVSALASLAQKICIQKDWVVVIAGGNKETLANLNANMRRIDLLVNILAPIAVGAIISVSMLVGGIFIAVWNAVSLVFEYLNIYRVYRNVPQLKIKGGKEFTDESLQESAGSSHVASGTRAVEPSDGNKNNIQSTSGDQALMEITELVFTLPPEDNPRAKNRCAGWWVKFSGGLKEMFEGWRVYRSYQEMWAGLGLAFLYMTVMGFDSITNGYGYSQGLPEWVIGVMMAVGSVTGILGTLLYPFLRRRVGLERSGLYSLTIQVAFLSLCLASVWAPGSPFTIDYDSNADTLVTDKTLPSSPVTYTSTTTMPTWSNNSGGVQCKYTEEYRGSFVSVSLFFAGMILSRIGLWSFDLVCVQLIQENVKETQRGVFSGVQRAMECSFDMIHFILVIGLPCPETFGILIILSFTFVVNVYGFYSVYFYNAVKIVVCMMIYSFSFVLFVVLILFAFQIIHLGCQLITIY